MIARAAGASLLVLALSTPLAGQGTVEFQGRLVHVDGRSTADLKVRFAGYGSTATTGNGQFRTHLPAHVSEVAIEILESDWVVLYPRDGRVPVPRDPRRVTEIVVGESVESATRRLVAERHERLAAGLKAVGAGQEEIKRVLTEFVQEVVQKLDINAADLQREVERQNRRGEHLPTISATVNAYLVAAKDLTEAFRLYGTTAFSDRQIHDELHRAAERYNAAFQALNNERTGFEYQVATYWNEAMLRDVRGLYDYALREVHRGNILRLNESLAVMHQALWGGLRDRQRIRDAQNRIADAVQDLDRRLPELDQLAARTLQDLMRH